MRRIEQAWQTRGLIALALLPLALVYRLIMTIRRYAYAQGWLATTPVSLPVVVVGNLSVGGTGKTPLCAYLVNHFQERGWRPAIVSRGYGGQRRESPHMVVVGNSPAEVGDEPLMLFQQTNVPVCVCTRRAQAVQHLAEHTDTSIVFADDGLQHLAMPREAEIVVVDGARGFGNGWSLPAGPMREPASRLQYADVIAIQAGEGELHRSLERSLNCLPGNGPSSSTNSFSLELDKAVSLSNGTSCSLDSFNEDNIVAIAGIGHPKRFFNAIRAYGLNVMGIAWPDHHVYSLADLEPYTDSVVLVTSKDAVKLKTLATSQMDEDKQRLFQNVFEVTTTLVPGEQLIQQVDALEKTLRQQFLS